ncbi:MAG: TonB-dependent receptor [Flavobacteriales bacterium]|nr:TonB-dependent receptor [Flavobacteriales bacterium]MBT5089625.1 TonB-dependent receptor [Flavobacteriales bacterium]MBT5750318.1 TonB-dependent receptor [Flavobacteriales bacterium]
MIKKFTLVIVTLCNLTLYSQNISGTITDVNNNEELIGANIILENGGGTATDVFGKYTLNINEGTQKVTFKYIGYEDIVKEITLVEGENKTINISLAQTSEQLGTVVVSAGRFEQKIEEITVSMEVIKPALIENKNTTDIQTAMDQIPGVNITDGQANIRGGSGWSFGAGTRVLVMVDDMPLISGDAGQVQWSLIATENINQVEVIKGASSALYGSSALNGVINIRTAFPKQKDIEKNKLPGYTKVNMHFGLIDKPKREELNWNGDKRRVFKGIEFLQSMKLNNLDLAIGGNIFKDDGFRQGEVTDRKRFNLNSTYKSKKIEGLSYGLNANFLFQTTGSAIIWNGLDQAYIPLNNEITNTNGDTYNIDPFITYMSGNNRHSLRTRYLKVINDNSTKGLDNDQDNKSEIYYSDYQWQKNIEKYNLRITTGTTNERVYAQADLFNGKNYKTNHSLYAQLDKKWNRLNISLGARYEHFALHSDEKYFINGDSITDFSASKPVFRTGLNYQLAEATYVRASWGQGYRFPSMAELFIATNFSGLEIYPNPQLKPENGWSSEIGIKQGVKAGKWMGYIDVAAFLMRYDDMMEFSFGQWGTLDKPDGGVGFKSINVGKTQISGLELSISGQGKINSNLAINVIAGYTYMNPISLDLDYVYAESINGYGLTYRETGSDSTMLKYRYKHIAKADIEIVYKEISLGGSVRYNSFMKNIDKIFTLIGGDGEGAQIPGINAAREKFKDGDFIVDLRVGYQATKTARIGFIVNNLLNREYMTRPATMMSPRTFAMQLALKI